MVLVVTIAYNVSCNVSGSVTTAEMLCENILYVLSFSDNERDVLSTETILEKSNHTMDLYLHTKYVSDFTVQSTAITQSGTGYSLQFNQY